MRKVLGLSFFIIFVYWTLVSADASIFDDDRKLVGVYITDVGDVQKYDCPYYDERIDCDTWPQNFFKFEHTKCVQIQGLYNFSAKVIVGIDKHKNRRLFVIGGGVSSFRDSKIKEYRSTWYQCPDVY